MAEPRTDIPSAFPICPYCGFAEPDDLDEYKLGDYTATCTECGKAYIIRVEPWYTTRKPEE